MGEYYQLDIVIRAIKLVHLKIPNIKMIMVGGGSDLEAIMKLVKNLRLEEVVLYLGYKLEKSEVAELISISDVGIIPYDNNPLWKNSLPVKSFEYFACGLPVLATVNQNSLLGKLIEDNKIGLISPSGDIYGLSKIMENIFQNRSFIETAGKRATSLIREHYDRNKLAEDLLKLIKDQ
jgi:glycosyltransferase involved in cell wall biosynthesis